jgi:hypothetical protein
MAFWDWISSDKSYSQRTKIAAGVTQDRNPVLSETTRPRTQVLICSAVWIVVPWACPKATFVFLIALQLLLLLLAAGRAFLSRPSFFLRLFCCVFAS